MSEKVRVAIEWDGGSREITGAATLSVVDTGNWINTNLNGTYTGHDLLCMLQGANDMVAEALMGIGLDAESVPSIIAVAMAIGLKEAESRADRDTISEMASDLGVEVPGGER